MGAAPSVKRKLSAVADTVSGVRAKESPAETIAHYEGIASQLWLPPKVGELADKILAAVSKGQPAWGSLSGPYGFGKTAASIGLWKYAREKQYLAIPPLSCTNFDELAYGIASLASALQPKAEKKVRQLFKQVWAEDLDAVVRTDAERYQVTPQKLRRLLQDKLHAGHLTFDTRCHRLVEFLAKLGEASTDWSNGLVVVLDELQQLLGPLDARAIVQFREFVWGMRTERTHCGIVVAFDSLLEARLARWATDVLHRIREHGPSLQLTFVYTREFPSWLWEKLTASDSGDLPPVDRETLTEDVLYSLGQFVERTDISNGPRTVVDVFSRAIEHYNVTGHSYDVLDLVEDVYRGRFRYFGEGAILQTVLTQLLTDEYVLKDPVRERLVRTLAAFPQGCPPQTLKRLIKDGKQLRAARSALFGPILVELSDGLALEGLQQVRRRGTNWEQILSRCWETLPALDALSAHMPDIIGRIVIPQLFPSGSPANPQWERLSDETGLAMSDWWVLRGTFDDNYPQREVVVHVSHELPNTWPRDVDLAIVMLCDSSLGQDAKPNAELLEKEGMPCVVINLPLMRPLDGHLPAELERYRKYVQPEPFRPATILSAIYELEGFLSVPEEKGGGADPFEEEGSIRSARAFVSISLDFVLREMIQGKFRVAGGHNITLRGPELLHALFAEGCRRRFPNYQTLVRTTGWRDVIATYRQAVGAGNLPTNVRHGREGISMSKAAMMKELFGQNSTAAGDSFMKALGPLAQTDGSPQVFNLKFSLHPGELSLLSYLKDTKSPKGTPVEACGQFLRHQGYVETEVNELISLLAGRELITLDKSGKIRIVQNRAVAREQLMESIVEAKQCLRRLGGDAPDPHENDASIKGLQTYKDAIDDLVNERVEEQVKSANTLAESLNTMIGLVSAVRVEEEWSTSEISPHLAAAGLVLLKSKQEIITALRKEMKRLSESRGNLHKPDAAWAISWRRKSDSFVKAEQKLKERVQVFIARANALTTWSPLNEYLRATVLLCEKVADSDPGPRKAVKELIRECRERLAVNTWGAISAAQEFADKLKPVQAGVQILLYRHVQKYNQELDSLKVNYNRLLPRVPAPVFEPSTNDNGGGLQAGKAFEYLYQWALGGIKDVIADCRSRKKMGESWRDPSSSHISWRDVDEQVQKALHAAERQIDFNSLCRAGDKALKMVRGFSGAVLGQNGTGKSTRVYDDPSRPPDFEELRDMFMHGKIVIRVEPSRSSDQHDNAPLFEGI